MRATRVPRQGVDEEGRAREECVRAPGDRELVLVGRTLPL